MTRSEDHLGTLDGGFCWDTITWEVMGRSEGICLHWGLENMGLLHLPVTRMESYVGAVVGWERRIERRIFQTHSEAAQPLSTPLPACSILSRWPIELVTFMFFHSANCLVQPKQTNVFGENSSMI